jgi:uncharacterized protein YjiS (DUF1127 family)
VPIRHVQAGLFPDVEEAMNRPYRTPRWSLLKRYFVEWRQRAVIRRELRMLSDRQCMDIGLTPERGDEIRKSFW